VIYEFPDQIRECLNLLSDEEIWWRPNEKANSIGNIILHLCGSLQFYFVHAIAEREFERNRPAEFTERSVISRIELLSRFDDVIAEIDGLLSSLDSGGLMQSTDRTGKTTTFAQILLHSAFHLAAHTGQIVYITKLLKEGAVDDLWIKAQSR